MTLSQAIITGGLYFFLGYAFLTSFTTWCRPVASGWIVGLFFGNPSQGAIIGANINLIYLGFLGTGGSTPGDMTLAGVAATALCLCYNYDVDTALTLAVPFGLTGNIKSAILMSTNSIWVRGCEKFINDGKDDQLWIPFLLGPFLYNILLGWLPVTLLIYLGGNALDSIIHLLGGKFTAALSVVGGMMPALGLAMTLNAIYKGVAKPFFFIGFVLTTYLGLPTIALAIVGLCCALVYTTIDSKIIALNKE